MVLPGSRNGGPIVACSPQLIGRSNPSRFSSLAVDVDHLLAVDGADGAAKLFLDDRQRR